jgi:tRNA-dihydrouridine synthase A
MQDPVRPRPAKTISVAPMMDWTDRHCRFFHRLIAPDLRLYTEMIATGAIVRGDHARHLAFDAAEHPVALQLGGADPGALTAAAKIGADYGYDEINLNCGCPSDRVQAARFGACLMAEPALVADCIAQMQAAVAVPVTVKTRIGIDESEEFDFLARFVSTVAAAGCETFIIHARKAWLSGLSPKENREIPPLRYDVAKRLKHEFPTLSIHLNGGLASLDAIDEALVWADGAMIGREAYQNPWFLSEVTARMNERAPARTRAEIVEAMLPYIERAMGSGVPLKSITRHMLGLFQGLPGARAWRRHLSEEAHKAGAGIATLREALALLEKRGAVSRGLEP